MTAPQILESLVQQYRWYHTIDLGDGLYTPGKRSFQHLNDKLVMMNLPRDLGGYSILDFGCNEGFFSIEAHRRGASRVVGVDNQQRKDVAAKFALAKFALSHDVELQLGDVHDLDPDVIGQFDMVFFLSVFHHLRHPFLALDKVASVTVRLAIMEFVIIDTSSSEDSAHLVRGFGHKGHIQTVSQ